MFGNPSNEIPNKATARLTVLGGGGHSGSGGRSQALFVVGLYDHLVTGELFQTLEHKSVSQRVGRMKIEGGETGRFPNRPKHGIEMSY